MKVTGFDVTSASHQRPSCPRSEPLSEPGAGAQLSRRSTCPPHPASLSLGAAAPSWVPESQFLLLTPWAFQSLRLSFGDGGAGKEGEVMMKENLPAWKGHYVLLVHCISFLRLCSFAHPWGLKTTAVSSLSIWRPGV